LGYLAVSAIVLTPNISVGESLGVAIKRLPSAIALTLPDDGRDVSSAHHITVISSCVVGSATGMTLERATVAAVVVALVPMFWLSIRLIIVWPLLVIHNAGPADAMRQELRADAQETPTDRGHIVLFGMIYLLTTGVAQIAGGSSSC
jgi:hypothetical protein